MYNGEVQTKSDFDMTEDELEIKKGTEPHLLACLNVAIDEAKEARLEINATGVSNYTRPLAYYTKRLQFLDREIAYLETMRAKIRSRLGRRSSVSG